MRVLPAGPSYAQIVVTAQSVRAHVRLPLEELDLVLRLDRDLDGQVSGAELDAARSSIAAYIARHLRVSADGNRLPLGVSGIALQRGADAGAFVEADTDSQARSRIGSVTIDSDFLSEVDAAHKTQAEIQVHSRAETFALGPGAAFQRQIGADRTSALLALAAVLALAALWWVRRRRAAPIAIAAVLTSVCALAPSAAWADVILSARGLNASLKAMERLKQQGDPESIFKLGAEADALASLINQEVESHGMQERALLDLALERTKMLGVAITYNRDKKKFFYDGAAFAAYLSRAPDGPHAEAASFQLLSYQFYLLAASDVPALTAAVESTKRFLSTYPKSPADVEARLFLAVDYRDLHRRYLDAHDAASAANYRRLARAECLRIGRLYPRTEQADAARQLMQGLGPGQ